MSAGDSHRGKSSDFATTQWSLVLAAGQRNSPESRQSLAALCRDYWYPLYTYGRRRTDSVHEAEDLTQEFFARLLEKNVVAVADPSRGRFRSFLLTSFKNFLANEWDKTQAKKRGSGQTPIPLELLEARSRYPLQASPDSSPERQFERQWALSLLDQVLDRLRDDCAAAGNREQFEALKGFITGLPDDTYGNAAHRLGITENAAKVAAHRLRRKYRERLREEIARTVAEPADVDDEIRYLLESLGR